MKSKGQDIIAYVYNSYNDPLIKGLFLPYLLVVAAENRSKIYLITYEQKAYRLIDKEKKRKIELLKSHGIYWYPLKWHSGWFQLLKKTYDLIRGFLLISYLKIKSNATSIFAFTNIAGAFGFIIAKILRMKFIIYSYEPHSQFMLELGQWQSRSLKYKLLSKLEFLMGKYGDVVITGTRYMVDRLRASNSQAKIYRLPSSVSEEKFVFSSSSRKRLKKELNLSERIVFLFLGKFNGLYCEPEILAQAFKVICQFEPKSFLMVVTPDPTDDITSAFKVQGIQVKDFIVTTSAYEIVPEYISAADIGIVGIPPSPSQKFRSPVKVAEYLLCGIPYIVCKGISEDDCYAEKHNVGVVLEDFSSASWETAAQDIFDLTSENKDIQRARCRKIGLQYRGFRNAKKVLKEIFSTF